MDIYERIKHLRKNIVKKTQEEFAEDINISRSNMGNLETARISITERVIKDICKAYQVNETWLRTGEGEWQDKTVRTVIDELTDKYGLSEMGRRMLETYVELEPEQRAVIEQYIRTAAGLQDGESPAIIHKMTEEPEGIPIEKYARSDNHHGPEKDVLSEERANKLRNAPRTTKRDDIK